MYDTVDSTNFLSEGQVVLLRLLLKAFVCAGHCLTLSDPFPSPPESESWSCLQNSVV